MNDEVYLKLDKNCEKVGKNLSKPVLHSTVRHKKQIDHLKHATNSPKKSAGDINTLKLTAKLNFGVHQRVFGDLTPINVNDSLLLPKSKISIPKKYMQSSGNIPIPDLRDFLVDVPPLKYVIEDPEIKLEFSDYDFNVLLNYKLFKS